MKFPRYPKYKPSGVEWLGDVPEHWEVCAVWQLFSLGRGRVISHEDIRENPGEYPVYSSQTENDGVLGCLGTYDFEGDYVTWTPAQARPTLRPTEIYILLASILFHDIGRAKQVRELIDRRPALATELDIRALPGGGFRGDWFIGIAHGSVSPALGRHIIEMLCRKEEDYRRFARGVGLPTRSEKRSTYSCHVCRRSSNLLTGERTSMNTHASVRHSTRLHVN